VVLVVFTDVTLLGLRDLYIQKKVSKFFLLRIVFVKSLHFFFVNCVYRRHLGLRDIYVEKKVSGCVVERDRRVRERERGWGRASGREGGREGEERGRERPCL